MPAGDEGRAGEPNEEELDMSFICVVRELRFSAFPGQRDTAPVQEGNFRRGEVRSLSEGL